MSGTQLITGSKGGGVLPAMAGYYPAEGTRVVKANYNWDALYNTLPFNTPIYDDLSNLISLDKLSIIQSVWIDNSQCAFPITLTVLETGQQIVVQGYAQGVYPIFFVTGRFSISATNADQQTGSVGNDYTTLIFLNVAPETTQFPSSNFPVDGGMQTGVVTNTVGGTTLHTQLKIGPGRVATVSVITAVTGTAFYLVDEITAGGQNIFADVPPSQMVPGYVLILNYQFNKGLLVSMYFATGQVAVSFT